LTRTLALTVTLVLLGFAGLQSAFLTSEQTGGGDNVDTLRLVQVSLSLLPESLGAIYREGLDPQVGFWIYPQEPVIVQVTLSNRSGKSIDVPRQPREWFEAARIQLVKKVPGQKTEAANTPPARALSGRLLQRSRVGPASLTAGILRLGTGSSETVRLDFDRSQSFDVRPGIYALAVSIDRRFVVTESANQLLHAEKLVGVRAIESRADVMNQAAHMAMWATMAKDFDAARRWLRELLAVNPGSFVAYTQMGNVAEAQGLCKEAIANWEQALQIVTANSDTAWEGISSGEDGISSLKRKIQRCQ
jgi:tetratricopeptide (TPR) repeat protein